MSPALALAIGVVVAAVLWFVVRLATRKSKLAKSLAFPLYVGALAAGLKVFTLLASETIQHLAPGLDRVLIGIFSFLIAIIAIRLIGLFYFDHRDFYHGLLASTKESGRLAAAALKNRVRTN